MMIVQLLKLSESPAEDAADALAVAICHAHSMRTNAALAGWRQRLCPRQIK